MKSHPGGAGHTRSLLASAALPKGSRVLDLGAGAGESLELLRNAGYEVEGIDLAPRSALVSPGDLLHTGFPDECFDAVLSQCAFFLSGDVAGALNESRRVLKDGGLLLLSDVFLQNPTSLLEKVGFRILQAEEQTDEWKDYYLSALWNGEDCGIVPPRGKYRYWTLIGRKE